MIQHNPKIGDARLVSRIIRDVRCSECDAVTEHWVNKQELALLDCPECGCSDVTAIIGTPKPFYTGMAANGESSSDAMGTAVDKWAKMRAQKQRIEQRNLERHGTYD
jgi:hypothetical protein